MNKQMTIILSFAFGISFIIVILLIALFQPNPTSFQYTIYRSVLALAGAGVAAVLSGFIQVKFKKWLRAGGALAIFAILYLVNPAAQLSDSNVSHDYNFDLNARNYRPLLTFGGKLDLEKHYMDYTDTIEADELQSVLQKGIGVRPNFTVLCSLQNVGNSVARIFGHAAKLDTTDILTLRKQVLSKNNAKNSKDSVFKYEELLPDHSIFFPIDFKFTFPLPERRYFLHLIIYYMNDLGNLYDLYNIYTIEFHAIKGEVNYNSIGNNQVQLNIHLNDSLPIVNLVNNRQFYNVYTEKEMRLFHSKFKNSKNLIK